MIIGDNVVIGQNLGIVTKDGADNVIFGDLTVTGTTSIDTGAGGDLVNLEGSNTNTLSTYTGAVNIQLGADNDTIIYATDANDAARFLSGGVVNGGPGTNTSTNKNLSDAVSTVPVTEINF